MKDKTSSPLCHPKIGTLLKIQSILIRNFKSIFTTSILNLYNRRLLVHFKINSFLNMNIERGPNPAAFCLFSSFSQYNANIELNLTK